MAETQLLDWTYHPMKSVRPSAAGFWIPWRSPESRWATWSGSGAGVMPKNGAEMTWLGVISPRTPAAAAATMLARKSAKKWLDPNTRAELCISRAWWTAAVSSGLMKRTLWSEGAGQSLGEGGDEGRKGRQLIKGQEKGAEGGGHIQVLTPVTGRKGIRSLFILLSLLEDANFGSSGLAADEVVRAVLR